MDSSCVEPPAKKSCTESVEVVPGDSSNLSKNNEGNCTESTTVPDKNNFEKYLDNDLLQRYEEQERYSTIEPSVREFDVLDESLESEDDELSCIASSVSSTSLSSSFSSDEEDSDSMSDHCEVPDDEIEMMLEEGLPEELRGPRQIKGKESTKKLASRLQDKLQGDNVENNEEIYSVEGGENTSQSNVEDKNGCDISNESKKKTDGDVQDCNEKDPLETVKGGVEQKCEQDISSKNDNEEGVNEVECETKTRVILQEIETNHFDLLPEGWIKLPHRSGMPVYLHRQNRVCTMARPYYLGPGSVRNHTIPVSAIPCLQYKRALENEKKNERTTKAVGATNDDFQLHRAKIETAAEIQAAESLDHTQLREYCEKLFIFKTKNSYKYKCWLARRRQAKLKKQEDRRQRLTVPDGTKLLKLTVPPDPDDNGNSQPPKEWILNVTDKSYVCILHEYVQHVLRKQPSYEFKELENPSTPYCATVTINGTSYGSATGASKKQAKHEAAKTALEILIPEMRNKIEIESGRNKSDDSRNTLSIFDEIKIEDPRVAEFCAKTSEPSPYAILLTCLQRNHALTDVEVKYSIHKKDHKKNVYTMTVGNHIATVTCKNKREGKQLTSQKILKLLHPHITSWGSLLRLYGNGSVKNVKEKKREEQGITLLQNKASLNRPNYSILNKLREEMLKLREKKMAMKPIGKFVPPDDVILPSLSSTDLNKVEL